MKKLASVLAVGLALSSAAAMASDGLLTVNGELKDLTCTINGGVGDIVVQLPTLSTSTITGSATGGSTKFTMNLTNCTAAGVKGYFEQGPNTSTLGNLKNISNDPAGVAANVEVQLKNELGEVIDLNKPATTQENIQAIVSGAGEATLTYYAQYKAVGVTTPGMVKGETTYSLIYN